MDKAAAWKQCGVDKCMPGCIRYRPPHVNSNSPWKKKSGLRDESEFSRKFLKSKFFFFWDLVSWKSFFVITPVTNIRIKGLCHAILLDSPRAVVLFLRELLKRGAEGQDSHQIRCQPSTHVWGPVNQRFRGAKRIKNSLPGIQAGFRPFFVVSSPSLFMRWWFGGGGGLQED